MTLEALAADHGLSVSAVRDSNPDLDLASLHPGDSLRLPPVEGLVVTVAAGDSLNALATRYSADAAAIAAYNQVDEDSLEKGEELVLPGGHLPPPQPPPTAPSPAPPPTAPSPAPSPAAPATAAPQKAQLAAAHVPPATPPAASSVQDIIRQAFAPLGPNAVAWALRVAACESGYNPRARNPSGASGLFQFMPSTWASTPQGRAGQSVWDPVANARAAAWYYQTGGPSRWSCR
jgi:soluble lytic murein transglycosylase-like protein